ncbi:MAG: GGDEF domain-containing protein [Sulfurimonas sp.]|nr:GGDEF domain-containing protein [Sulfurimonas sp.]
MKHSIKKIFSNLSLLLLLAAVFAGLGALLSFEHTNSYIKIDNLNDQKRIISNLRKLSTNDSELILIQLTGNGTQLHYEIGKLKTLYKYNFMEKYILSNSKEYLGDLNKLSSLTTKFNTKALAYYKNKDKKEIKKKEFETSFYNLNKQLNLIIFKSIEYNKIKHNIHNKITFIAFIVILLIAMWYRKRLALIYEDLLFLYNIDKKNHTTFSEEIDAIALRMKRKVVTSDNPTMLDPITGINNLKGLINSYGEKKSLKESNFTSVTTLEIENFSKSNRVYSQEFTQSILKKVAFTMSLHEQSADVIARTDYNQFTVILSRPSKEQSFKDIDIIRQSINELKLKSSQTGPITITISGGLIIKPNNMSLDEALRKSKKVLLFSKKNDSNKISQIRDLAEDEL